MLLPVEPRKGSRGGGGPDGGSNYLLLTTIGVNPGDTGHTHMGVSVQC